MPVRCLRTDGPSENVLLMHRRVPVVHLSMVTMGIAGQAWDGVGAWTDGQRFREMRALFPMFETAFHGVALRRSGIEKLAQLQTKSIGVGPRGGTSGTYFPAIMNTLGIPVFTTRYGEGEDLRWQVENGLLDAFLFASGVPTPYFTKLSDQHPIAFLDFTAPALSWLEADYPGTYASRIGPNKYQGQPDELKVLATFNFAICHKDLSEDFVYKIMKAVFSDPDRLTQYIREKDETLEGLGHETSLKSFHRNKFLRYHQGAVRYLLETDQTIDPGLL